MNISDEIHARGDILFMSLAPVGMILGTRLAPDFTINIAGVVIPRVTYPSTIFANIPTVWA
jgi:hypothetical protein